MRAEWNFLYDVHGADDDGDNNDDNNGGNKGYNNEGNDTKKNDNNHFICIFGIGAILLTLSEVEWSQATR